MSNLTTILAGLSSVFVLSVLYYPASLQKVQFTHKSILFRVVLLVPSQCPFERNIDFGPVHMHVPPLCKLNPLSEKLEELRFKAVCFAVEQLGIPYEQLV